MYSTPSETSFFSSRCASSGRAAATTRPHTEVSKDCEETGAAQSPSRPAGPPPPGTVQTDRGGAASGPRAPVGRANVKGDTNGAARSVGSPRCGVASLPASSKGGGASVEDKRDEIRPAGGTAEVRRAFFAVSAICRGSLVISSTQRAAIGGCFPP